MSETLEVLIKLAERKVEEAQIALTQTREALQGCRDQQEALRQEAENAFTDAVSENDVVALQAAHAFQERIRLEMEALVQVENALQAQEDTWKAELQTRYAGQKKYELLMDKQRLAKRKEHAKKAQHALDEAAGNIKR